MDYDKKKVKEAFALLKELYPIMNDYTKGKIAGIFPELKESEDERIRNLLRRIVITANDGDLQMLGDDDTKKCLAWLEKQKEQKPVEWREEDKRMIQSIIWHLRHSVNNGDTEHTAGQLENWLKSLRPQPYWKPSEEQMEIGIEKFTDKIEAFQARYEHPEIVSIEGAMAFMARMFYQYPNTARKWYERLPKATMDERKKREEK